MTKNPNGRNLRGWIALAVTLAIIFATICIAWGGQMRDVATNKVDVKELKASRTQILESLARIETKLEGMDKRKPMNPKEIEP